MEFFASLIIFFAPWRCLPFIPFTKRIIPYTNIELASYNYQYIQEMFRNNDLIFLTLFLECMELAGCERDLFSMCDAVNSTTGFFLLHYQQCHLYIVYFQIPVLFFQKYITFLNQLILQGCFLVTTI